MNRIKVVFFRNARGISDVTGAESYLISLMEGFSSVGVDALLVAAIRPGQDDSPWLVEVKRRRLKFETIVVDSRYSLADFWQLRRHVRHFGGEVIHSLDHRSDVVGAIAARSLGCPHIASFFGWTNFTQSSLKGKIYAIVDRLVQSKVDRLITDSAYMAQFAGGAGKHSKAAVVPNGIDIDRFDPDTPAIGMREKLFGSGSGPIIGMLGRIHPNKGQLDFVEIAATLHRQRPTCRFLIIGDAPPGHEQYKREVLDKIVDKELEGIVALTNVPSEDVPQTFAMMDILMAPSYIESFSFSMLEGMSMALPLVASDVGGAREMVEDGSSGYLVNAGDVDGFSDIVKLLIDSEELRRKVGLAARTRVEKLFTRRVMAESTAKVYRSVLERS